MFSCFDSKSHCIQKIIKKWSKKVIESERSNIFGSKDFRESFSTETVVFPFWGFVILRINVIKERPPVDGIKTRNSAFIRRSMILCRFGGSFLMRLIGILRIIKQLAKSKRQSVVFISVFDDFLLWKNRLGSQMITLDLKFLVFEFEFIEPWNFLFILRLKDFSLTLVEMSLFTKKNTFWISRYFLVDVLIGLNCVFELFAEVIHDFLKGLEERNLFFLLEGDIERIKQFHLVKDFIFEGSQIVDLRKGLSLIVRVQLSD